MSIETYDKGDVLRVTVTYTNVATGAVIDPAVVKFKKKTPAGVVTEYTYLTDNELVRVSTGVFYVDVPFNQAGDWFVRHYSTGTGEAAQEKQYRVRNSAFP